MKKLISSILCLCMVLCTFGAVTVFAADAPWQGSGTEEDPWLISTADDLVTLSANAYNGYPYENKFFKMTKDIDMSSVANFTPIGRKWANDFRATFDGANYKIKNLNIESGNGDGNGLFGYTTDSTIKNVIIESGTIVGTSGPVGAILGRANYGNRIINCKNYATVQGTWNVGGIVGDMWDNDVTIDGCYNAGNIINTGNYTGGILGSTQQNGKSERYIRNCVNDGIITADKSDLGGIMGKSQGNGITIENCVNNADINVSVGSVGGIAGSATPAAITSCVNNGDITGTGNVAGIAGYNSGDIDHCVNNGDISHTGRGGGITGDTVSGHTISFCANYGDVTATTGDNGGITGHMDGGSLVTDCYNTGVISGGTLGGISGSVDKCRMINCYSIGATSSNNSAIIGWSSNPVVENCYYNGDVCPDDGKATKMTTDTFASGKVAATLNANHVEYQVIDEVSTLVAVPASVWSNDEVKPIFADEDNAPVYKYVIKGAKAEDITLFPKVKAAETLKLIVASYSDLAMQDVESQSIEAGDVEVTLSDFVTGDEVKIMVWDSYVGATPLTAIPVQ